MQTILMLNKKEKNLPKDYLMNWISVKDKLPEDLEREIPELFCCSEGLLVMAETSSSGPSPVVGIASWGDNKWVIVGGEGFHSDTGTYALRSEDITHWVPLPGQRIL
jgi:hypothetical protein